MTRNSSKRPALQVSVVLLLMSTTLPTAAQNVDGTMKMTERAKKTEPKSGCSDRLMAFIKEIDERFESSSSIDPLIESLSSYFPVAGCNVEQAISIAKTSKYFESVTDYPKDVVIVLRSKSSEKWGFKVSFGLKKDTGESIKPNATVDMQKREIH